jgi:hypothetical protein
MPSYMLKVRMKSWASAVLLLALSKVKASSVSFLLDCNKALRPFMAPGPAIQYQLCIVEWWLILGQRTIAARQYEP